MNIDDAIDDIYTVCESTNNEKFPFFLIVGAGVSSPEIPLASQIITKCQNKCKNRKDYNTDKEKAENLSSESRYSFWLERAFPSKELRRQFFDELITKSKITSSNFQIANILSSGKLFNLVLTPNFDNQIEKSLNIMNYYSYYVSKNEIDNLSINLRSNEVQIIHVHGDYKNYSFKNTNKEIESVSCEKEFLSMSELVNEILKDRAPIFIGYSGWENDVIMTALKKRLTKEVPYNYYWFCYSEKDYERLPNWLKTNDNVKFIYTTIDKTLLEKFTKLGYQPNLNLPASNVLSRFSNKFDIKAPKLFEHPLLHCENLIDSLSRHDQVYDLDGWLDEYKALNKVKNNNEAILFDVIESYNAKNFSKFIIKLRKALSMSSNLGDKKFDFLCENYLQRVLNSNELPNNYLERLIDFAFRIPDYRNTYKTRATAILANFQFIANNPKCNYQYRFRRLFAYFDSNEKEVLIAMRTKILLCGTKSVQPSDYNIVNPFFSDENDIPYNLLFFPEYILLSSMDSLKKEDSSGVISLLKNINREENSFLRNNKEIRKQLKRIIPILEDIDDWQDKIYSITRKNFKISKEEYPTINLKS